MRPTIDGAMSAVSLSGCDRGIVGLHFKNDTVASSSVRQSESRCLVLVPAYNEAESIEATLIELAELPQSRFVVVVIDDGSTDGTSEKAEKIIQQTGRGRVERHVRNLGVGGALAHAIRRAVASGEHYDSVAQFDADGQHRAADLWSLVQRRNTERIDLIVGSRYAYESRNAQSIPESFLSDHDTNSTLESVDRLRGDLLSVSTPTRRLGGWLLSWSIRQCTGQRATDPTSGLRCFAWSVACELVLSFPDGVSEPVALAWALCRGLRVKEQRVSMRPRRRGRSSLDWRRAVPFMLRTLWGIWTTSVDRPALTASVAASPRPKSWLRLTLAGLGILVAFAGCEWGSLKSGGQVSVSELPEHPRSATSRQKSLPAGPADAQKPHFEQRLPPIVGWGRREVCAEFRFRNSTGNPLRAVDVTGSCGCLAAELAEQVVAPGEVGILKVRIDATLVGQPYEKSVTATVRWEMSPEWKFTTVFAGYPTLVPRSSDGTIDFEGASSEDGLRDRKLTVDYYSTVSEQRDAPCLSVEGLPSTLGWDWKPFVSQGGKVEIVPIAPGIVRGSGTLTIFEREAGRRWAPTGPVRVVLADVSEQYQGKPPSFNLTLRRALGAEVRSFPGSLVLTAGAEGAKIARARLLREDRKAFEVATAGDPAGLLIVRWAPAGEGMVQVEIEIPTGETPVGENVHDVALTFAGEEPRLTIPVLVRGPERLGPRSDMVRK
jgi:hypothetical protein